MRLAQAVKPLLPPVALDAARSLRRLLRGRRGSTPDFEGVYADFSAVGLPSGAGFATEAGVRWAMDKARFQGRGRDDWLVTGNRLPGDDFLIALLNLLMMGDRRVTVYDVGGGVGNTFLAIRPYLSRSQVRWLVIDQPALVEAGCGLLEGDGRISFSERFPEAPISEAGVSTVGLMRTAVQYFPDPAALIGELARGGVMYLVFIRLPAGEIPDFVTVQHFLGGTSHPFHFFNLANFVRLVQGLGYELVYRCGDSEFFHMGNFPPALRLAQSITLAFARRGVGLPTVGPGASLVGASAHG